MLVGQGNVTGNAGYQLYCADTHLSTYTRETLQLKTPVISKASQPQMMWFRKVYGFISAFLHCEHANVRMGLVRKEVQVSEKSQFTDSEIRVIRFAMTRVQTSY